MTMRDRWDRFKKTVEENEALKKTKSHLARHKTAYIVGGSVAAGMAIFAAGRHFGHVTAVNTALVENGEQNTPMVAGRDIINPTITNTINNTQVNIGNDALSYITREVGTDNYFLTQAGAAEYDGVSPQTMSAHILHNRPLASNRQFERIGIRG